MRALLESGEKGIRAALAAAHEGREALFGALRAMPAPIYVTDHTGVVIFFNEPCIGFAGRTPVIGKDLWCVTWKLFTDEGKYLPHEECPMAAALRTQQKVRGITAIAERPDGTRVRFLPFPTPWFGPSGELAGAINLLIDVTDARQIEELRTQADRCRRLAREIGHQHTVDVLATMADEYDAKASLLEQRH